MKPIFYSILLPLLVAGCSFSSELKTKVEVYGGETVPVLTVLNPQNVLKAAVDVENAVRELNQQLVALPNELPNVLTAYQATRDAYGEYLANLSQTETYQNVAKAYPPKWSEALNKLKPIIATTSNQRLAFVGSQIPGIRDLFYTPNLRPKIVVQDVNVDAFLWAALNKKIRDSASLTAEEIKQSRKLLSQMRQSFFSSSSAQQGRAQKQIVDITEANLSLIENLGAELETIEFMPGELVINKASVPTLGLPQPNDVITAGLAEDSYVGLLKKVHDLKQETARAATQLFGLQSQINADPTARIDDEAKLIHATIQLADAATAYSDQAHVLLDRFRSKFIEVQNELKYLQDPKDPYVTLDKKLDPDIRKRNADARQVDPEAIGQNGLTRIATDAFSLIKSAQTASTKVQSKSQNAVELSRTNAFTVGDPNILRITECEELVTSTLDALTFSGGGDLIECTDSKWQPLPLDELRAQGDGHAQYIIVQESPKHFRLKKLRVDPAGVVDLQVSFADAAVDLMSKIALNAAGVPIPQTGTSNQETALSSSSTPITSEQEQVIQDSYEQTLKSLRLALQGVRDSLGTDTSNGGSYNATVEAKLKGILQSHQARLHSIIQSAKTLASQEDSGSNN